MSDVTQILERVEKVGWEGRGGVDAVGLSGVEEGGGAVRVFQRWPGHGLGPLKHP